jgi:hypothetical protein
MLEDIRLILLMYVTGVACRTQATPKVVSFPAAPGGATGHIQMSLRVPVSSGWIVVDGVRLQLIESPTDVIVVQRVPVGFHEISVVGLSGSLAKARVEVQANVVTRASFNSKQIAHVEVARPLRPPPVTTSPSPPVRPCTGGFRFASRLAVLLPTFGARACLPIGRHVTFEAVGTTVLALTMIDAGFSVHLGSDDRFPYLAVRGGFFASVVIGGLTATPSIGWRFGDHYLEAGPVFVPVQSVGEGWSHSDLVGASVIFGRN